MVTVRGGIRLEERLRTDVSRAADHHRQEEGRQEHQREGPSAGEEARHRDSGPERGRLQGCEKVRDRHADGNLSRAWSRG